MEFPQGNPELPASHHSFWTGQLDGRYINSHKEAMSQGYSSLILSPLGLFPLWVLPSPTQSDNSTLNEPLQHVWLQTSCPFLQPEAVFYLALGNPQTSQLRVMEPDHFNSRDMKRIQTKMTCVSFNMEVFTSSTWTYSWLCKLKPEGEKGRMC